MSAFYDLASLVLVPSGYKASKVYAQKPLTTDGQLTFSRASTATRVNSAGLIETVSSNVPRLDYLNSSCPRLLLEPQRTNIVTYSESFNNAAYSKISGGAASTPIVTANFATSPDGYQNADRIQFARTGTTASDFSAINQSSLTLSATGTATIYLKSNTSSNQNVLMYWGGGQGQVFTVTPEWQRFTLTNLTAATDAIVIGTRGGSGSFFNGGSLTLDVLFYGFQLEAGAYATSYIPTTTAAVTRLADACSKTGISSLIGQTAGTIYAEWTANNVSTSGRIIAIGDGSFNNRIVVLEDGNSVRVFIATSNVVQADLSPLGNYVGTHKIAVAYANNDLKVYIDGVAVATGTTLSVPPCSVLYVGTFEDGTGTTPLGGGIAQTLLFKTRLTNAQLAELTTL